MLEVFRLMILTIVYKSGIEINIPEVTHCMYDAQTGYCHYSFISNDRVERRMTIEHEQVFEGNILINESRIAKVIVND